MIWRQVAGVNELVRLLRTEGLLWATPQRISQQAVSERLRTLPAELFLRLYWRYYPVAGAMASAAATLPPEIAWAQGRYRQMLIHDGSTLDALLRQVGLLRGGHATLGGSMTALLDWPRDCHARSGMKKMPRPRSTVLAATAGGADSGQSGHFRSGLHQFPGVCQSRRRPGDLADPG